MLNRVSYAPTEASTDSEPPRFRTVDSWVGNQSERVQKRADREGADRQTIDDDVPAVPQIPREVV